MINFRILFLATILSSLTLSCSQKPAQISNKSKNLYTKNSKKYHETSQKKSSNNEIEISSGETLYSISKKYNAPLRDIISENNISPPYSLKAGTKIKIPSTKYHEVQSGDTIYSISKKYQMKIDNLIEINNLHTPYNLIVGQKVKISKSQEIDEEKITSNKSKSSDLKAEENKSITKSENQKSSQEPEKRGFVEKTLDKLNHFSSPLRGKIISKFGPKSGGLYNDGINIAAKEGAPVKASESGNVAYVGNELKGYGNLVIIKHSGGWITAYAHLQNCAVKRGDKVAKGEKIGLVGSTGNVNSPQLYFGLRKGRDAVNPENYLK